MVYRSKSEELGYAWLKKQGYEMIFYRPCSIPDFQTEKGGFEVKRGYKMLGGLIKILFGTGQRDRLKQLKATTLVFIDNEEEPISIIPYTDLDKNVVGNILLHETGTKSKMFYLRCRIPLSLSEKMDIIIKNNTYPNVSSLVTKAVADLLVKEERIILS